LGKRVDAEALIVHETPAFVLYATLLVFPLDVATQREPLVARLVQVFVVNG